MNYKQTLMTMLALLLFSSTALAADPDDDPFHGGFPMNYSAEIYTLGPQGDSLLGWGFDWLDALDTIVMMGSASLPESYLCGADRDVAAADFDGDYMDELVMAWNRADGGVFVGIPTLDDSTLIPDPAGWHVPATPIGAGVLYASDTLASLLGEIRLVAGNFYSDRAMEFVLAYLAADSTVTLMVFDVDSASSEPALKASLSNQAVYTNVPPSQRFDKTSRFDLATGDFDGDGLDEIALVANDPAESPASDLVLALCDYDTLGHVIVPESPISFSANGSPDHTCLRRLMVVSGHFDTDSLAELAVMHRWANPIADTTRIGALQVLDLIPAMTGISSIQTDTLPPVPFWVPTRGVSGGYVQSEMDRNGELFVGGRFTTAGGISANHVARWNGRTWQAVGSGITGDPFYNLFCFAEFDGDLIAGGQFEAAGGPNNIARWDGAAWHQVGSGTNYPVEALSIYDGELIAGGIFTSAGGVPVNRIARWNGSAWDSLGSGLTGGLWGVIDLTIYDGLLIAGGNFSAAGGVAANAIARWDGSSWDSLGSGMIDGVVNALAVYDGELIAGGSFTSAGGTPANYIARWNGSTWQPLGLGLSGGVWALTVYNGELIAGGEFTSAGGVAASRIARWNGSTWQPLGSGMSYRVYALAVYNGELVAGGDFTIGGGVTVNRIARWNGSVWQTIDLGRELPMGLVAGDVDDTAVGDRLGADETFATTCRDNGGLVEQYVRAYGFDTSAAPMICGTQDTVVIASIGSDVTPLDLYTGRRSLALGKVTGEGETELAMLLSDNSGSTRLGVFGLYPDALSGCGLDSVIMKGDGVITADNLSELVLADLDSATVTIGSPRAYHIDSVVQPLAIVNAPPVHYDLLSDTIWDVSRRYEPSPPPTYETHVAYTNTSSWTVTTETEVHRDWGVSTALEAWASAGGFSGGLLAAGDDRVYPDGQER